jgi:hypothetical protein
VGTNQPTPTDPRWADAQTIVGGHEARTSRVKVGGTFGPSGGQTRAAGVILVTE